MEQQVCTDLQRTARRTCRYGIPHTHAVRCHTHAVRCCQLTITWLGPRISGDADDEPCMSTSQWAKCVRLDPPVQNTSVRHQVRSCPADKSRCRCAASRTLPWQCPRASSVLPWVQAKAPCQRCQKLVATAPAPATSQAHPPSPNPPSRPARMRGLPQLQRHLPAAEQSKDGQCSQRAHWRCGGRCAPHYAPEPLRGKGAPALKSGPRCSLPCG